MRDNKMPQTVVSLPSWPILRVELPPFIANFCRVSRRQLGSRVFFSQDATRSQTLRLNLTMKRESDTVYFF